MNTAATQAPITDSTLWITSLVNGLSGLTIKVRHPVHFDASPFQKIEVFDTFAFGRILLLGGSIVLTERDEFIYNEMLTHTAIIAHGMPKRVCIIGGGDGGVLREVLKHPSVEEAVVVEIDELVVNTIKQHFEQLAEGFNDPRAQVVIDDGLAYLEQSNQPFDVIIVDAYDPGGPIQSLLAGPFYETVRHNLTESGIAAFQTDSPTVNPAPLRDAVAQAQIHFASTLPYLVPIPSFPDGLCSFVLCQCAEGNPGANRDGLAAVSATCRYFNEAVLGGAFKLPANVQSLIL